jgi:uncharacterized protein (TIRG00374 family)
MLKSKILYVKILITAALIGYLLNAVGLRDMYHVIKGGSEIFFLCSCVFVPLFIVTKTLKWHLMTRYSGATEGFSTSLSAVLVGLGFSIFTPMRAGEILRVTYYKSVEKVVLGGLVIVDRLLDLLTVLYMCLYFVVEQYSLLTTLILFLVISSLFITLFVVRELPFSSSVAVKNRKAAKLWQYIGKLESCLKVLTPMNIIRLCGISFVVWAVAMVQFYFIMNTYHEAPFKVILAGLPIIQLSNLLPITIGGIGVRENLSVMVMRPYDIPQEVAAMSAFTLYAIDILIPGMVGWIVFSTKKGK